jgi:prepilin signal peptidase PulO-like enzyme (type II secretory pathway)
VVAFLSEEKEEKQNESWTSALGIIHKVHPVFLLLSIGLMNLFSFVYNNSEMPFDLKLLACGLTLFFFLLAITFESYRLDREKELKEKGLA